jgi:hypothetical protein
MTWVEDRMTWVEDHTAGVEDHTAGVEDQMTRVQDEMIGLDAPGERGRVTAHVALFTISSIGREAPSLILALARESALSLRLSGR